ncbi:MAG: hypothetical protein ACI8W3_002741, partial [Myxococcota bacterium]
GREGETVASYLGNIFANVPWGRWLALMVPYSFLFFLIDSLVLWRVVNWYNADVRYRDILPIRGSSYILSIINEQVGKGAMALYLHRRNGVPGWEVGSSMLFIMFCEFFYLLTWACIGYALRGDLLPEVFSAIPKVAVVAALFFIVFRLFFTGKLFPNSKLRDKPIFHAFRQAKTWHFGMIILLRSPALLSAVWVYTSVLGYFGVEVTNLEMLGYLPIIFFGAATPGPMRTVAITLWVVLFPGFEGQMTAFGFVQHNFFIFFNAAIGLMFLGRANRELFGTQSEHGGEAN